MSNIVGQLEALLQYLADTKQVGHSHMMRFAVERTGESVGIYIDHDHAQQHRIQDGDCIHRAFGLDELMKLKGLKLPMVIDNGALTALLERTVRHVIAVESENKEMKNKLDLIKRVVG